MNTRLEVQALGIVVVVKVTSAVSPGVLAANRNKVIDQRDANPRKEGK